MKNLYTVIPILGVLVLFLSCARENPVTAVDADVVPDLVQTALQEKYPEAGEVEWYQSGNKFEAEFEADDRETTVLFNKRGKLLMTETELEEGDLPQSVRDYLAANYPDHPIEEADKEENRKGLFYEVELMIDGQEVELRFDADGNFIEAEKEEAEQ